MGVKVIKRYEPDSSCDSIGRRSHFLREDSKGRAILADDLPVQALGNFRPTVEQQHQFGNVNWDLITVLFTERQYNALRKLLLTIRPNGGNATTGE